MFRQMMLPVSIYFICGVLSGLYSCSFLTSKRNKKLTCFLWMILYIILQFLAFEVVARKYPIVDVIAVVINATFIFALQLFLFRRDITKQFFVIATFLAGKETVKYIASIVYHIAFDWEMDLFNSLFDKGLLSTTKQVDGFWGFGNIIVFLITDMVYVLLLGGYLHLINKKFVRREYKFSKPEYFFLITPAICAICVSVAIRMMFYSVEDGVPVFIYEKVTATLVWIPIACILLLASIIITVIIFQNIVGYHDEMLKSKVLESQVTQIQREVAEMQEIYSDIKGLKHDMRNHLANIAMCITSGVDPEGLELKDYIGEMEETINKLDFAFQTGNPITDVIIHHKSQEAIKKNIKFTSDFSYPSKKQIDVYDVGVILNNAIDNAIEACEKVEGDREITVLSYEKGNLFFIEIHNTFFDIVMDDERGMPLSHKADKEMHGFGMYNIEKSAQKYMGGTDIELQNKDGKRIFVLTVMLCNTCE